MAATTRMAEDDDKEEVAKGGRALMPWIFVEAGGEEGKRRKLRPREKIKDCSEELKE